MRRFERARFDLGQLEARNFADEHRKPIAGGRAGHYIRAMRTLCTLAFCLLATAPQAHPHIFIDTGLTGIVDGQGRLTHVRIVWEYDALYSLLVTEDMGLDDDYDGQLTDAETDRLNGFDMQWIEGFNGDLVMRAGGEPVVLSGPTDTAARLQDGKIITEHTRALAAPIDLSGAQLSIKPFDNTFYTAYDVTKPVALEGIEGCEIKLFAPVMTEALSELRQVLAGLPVDQDPADIGMADAGEKFATDIRISCPGG